MLERDEYGYVLKMSLISPTIPGGALRRNWWRDFATRKRRVSFLPWESNSPKFGLGSFENPKMIGRGEVDAVSLTLP